MKRMCRFAWLCLVLPGLAFGQGETKVRVTGQRINLRAKPDTRSEVVGQSSDGDVLTAKSYQDDWVEVAPPDSVDLWVHRDFLKDNVVSGTKLYVRAGAGINFSVVGTLTRGETVVPRGDFGEWIRIAPPPGCSLWVSRSYVDALQPQKTKPPVVAQTTVVEQQAPPAAPPPVPAGRSGAVLIAPDIVSVPPSAPSAVSQPAPARPAAVVPASATPPSVPKDLDLIPLEGQGRQVQRDGYLKPVGFLIRRPSKFRLVRMEPTKIDTICYVRGNNAQLESFLGQRLLIRGREYWVQGMKYPVVIPEQIVPKAE